MQTDSCLVKPAPLLVDSVSGAVHRVVKIGVVGEAPVAEDNVVLLTISEANMRAYIFRCMSAVFFRTSEHCLGSFFSFFGKISIRDL